VRRLQLVDKTGGIDGISTEEGTRAGQRKGAIMKIRSIRADQISAPSQAGSRSYVLYYRYGCAAFPQRIYAKQRLGLVPRKLEWLSTSKADGKWNSRETKNRGLVATSLVRSFREEL
jgi:hypothetical protein